MYVLRSNVFEVPLKDKLNMEDTSKETQQRVVRQHVCPELKLGLYAIDILCFDSSPPG